MNRITKSLVFLLLIFVFLLGSNTNAAFKDGKKQNSVSKTAGDPQKYKLNINNISTFLYATGETDINGGNAGLEFPKGSNKHPVYQSGFLWGGKINGTIHVGGSTFSSGLLPGAILPNGTAEDPEAPDVRMWRVRVDYATGSMATEMREGEGSESAIREQYKKDWDEWPAAKGAPYEDVDSNGVYDPAVDIPGFPGATQTVWWVTNDLDPDVTQTLYGSLPMGIECQITMWAYSSAGALANMDFRRYKIINKSSTEFTDMYVSAWSDADVGDATDDFAGVDTVLSLGYVYNGTATDAEYLNTPPATGFDFFQGPIIAGEATDTATFGGQKIAGKKNMPATAFYYFINSDETYGDPDLGEYETGSLYFYNLFQGKISSTGKFFPVPDELGGGVTTFPLSGDPVTQTGYLDGIYFSPGDRRYGLSSGPFTMAVGDTQEIVLAQLVAGGTGSTDNLQAVKLLKQYDVFAQQLFEDNFELPTPPQQPKLTVINLDQEVVLNWADPATYTKTESYDNKGFTFQGYNVYQLPSISAPVTEGVKIATFDLDDDVTTIVGAAIDPATGVEIQQVQQSGNNTGIKRFLSVKRDYLRNTLLVNGTRYFYAVTAYTYNPDPIANPNNVENPIITMMAVPQSPNPGYRFAGQTNDTLTVQRLGGKSDGYVAPIVVNPSAVTGHQYNVQFRQVDDPELGSYFVWDVIDKDANNKIVVTGETNQEDNFDYPIVDGIMVKVVGPALQVNSLTFTPAADRWFTGVNAGLEALGGGLGVGANFFGTSVNPADMVKVELRFVSDKNNGQRAYRYLRGGSPTYSYQDYEKQYFTVWDVESNPPRQLSAAYIEQNGVAAANQQWEPTTANSDREYLFIFNTDYTETPQQALMDMRGNSPDLPTLYAWWPLLRSGYTFNPQDGQVLTITPTYVNTPNDVFTFKSPAITKADNALAKEDVDKIKAFPNPYYGVNPQEINKYERFVTFNHMPPRATVRIFNLAGQLVRTMEKNDNDQFFRWDLANDSGIPVASGVFVVYIDMPEIGATKILKVAIIQEQQILDRF